MLDKDAILFDLDGVIIDSEHHYLLLQLEVLKHDGLDVTEENLYPLVGLEWDNHFEFLAKLYNHTKTPEQIKKDYHEYHGSREIDYNDWVFNDLISTLEILKKNDFKMAVVSNSKTEIIEKVLIQLNIVDYFDFYIGSDQVEKGKPSPDIYLEAIKRLDKNPKSVIVIEDSYSGIQAARGANLTVFAIEDIKFNTDQSAADYIIKGVSQILDCLVLCQENGEVKFRV